MDTSLNFSQDAFKYTFFFLSHSLSFLISRCRNTRCGFLHRIDKIQIFFVVVRSLSLIHHKIHTQSNIRGWKYFLLECRINANRNSHWKAKFENKLKCKVFFCCNQNSWHRILRDTTLRKVFFVFLFYFTFRELTNNTTKELSRDAPFAIREVNLCSSMFKKMAKIGFRLWIFLWIWLWSS